MLEKKKVVEGDRFNFPIPPEAAGDVELVRDHGGTCVMKDEAGRKWKVYGIEKPKKKAPGRPKKYAKD
jgi:hypothetical protein